MELSNNDKSTIFINTIQKTYGVGCSPNQNPKYFKIQRPFVDSWNMFGKGRDVLFREEDLQIVWGAMLKGEWNYDLNNPYVQMWIGVPLV